MQVQKTSSSIWFKRTNINHRVRKAKAIRHLQNLAARAEVNRARSNNKTNPTFHGNGYHALGKVRKQKKHRVSGSQITVT